MLQAIKDLQNRAVSQLVSLKAAEITFKAPTGSGKTYMMADMMNRILAENDQVVFLVSTLSKGDLARQNYEKFCEYQNRNFRHLRPYLISSQISGEERLFVPTDYNVYVLPRDLYKKHGRLMQGVMENFLHNITDTPLLQGQHKQVFLIKDECHIATNNLDELSQKFFSRVYNFSATPKLKRNQYPDVEISESDAIASKLIKSVELNEESDIPVSAAIEKLLEIKKNYRNLLNVNPCLIIQISNKDKADEEILEVKNELAKTDLKWMLIVNEPKNCDTNDFFKAKKLPIAKWKDFAKENTSTIDVIIFKMVITEGWDIPRACMLYQQRNSQSRQLDEQVMGRVRRNPRLLDFENLSEEAQKLATTAWIWGIVPPTQKSERVFLGQLDLSSKIPKIRENIIDEIKIKTTILKDLTKRNGFDISNFIENFAAPPVKTSIFELHNRLNNADDHVKNMCNDFADTFTKWLGFTENLAAITRESNKYIHDYTKSMQLAKDENGQDLEVSLAANSHYVKTEYYTEISNWIWKRRGNEEFHFDSIAEKEWSRVLRNLSERVSETGENLIKQAKISKKSVDNGQINLFETELETTENMTKIYLWGKNYTVNSRIKFEYYLNGKHSSYPDFVMKDCYNRIHIFEVKSVNHAADISINENDYNAKITELKKAYCQASALTKHIFYLPIQRENDWVIFQYVNGAEKVLDKREFVRFCQTSPR